MSLLPPIPTNFRAATALPPLIKLDRRTDVLLRMPALCDVASPQTPRRSRIWELAETLHCSIMRLYDLPEDTRVFLCHDYPAQDVAPIGAERMPLPLPHEP